MSATPGSGMFGEGPKEERSFPTAAVAIAAVAVVILVGLFVVMGRGRKGDNGASYAPSLVVSNVEVSAASSMAGGTTTYVDGHLTNNGKKTVTGVTLEATFAMSDGTAPQRESDLAKAIRTRDPMDLEPMNSAPIAPGGSADFRLIFEDVKAGWDQQAPGLKVVAVATK